jgi:hypothetical protein
MPNRAPLGPRVSQRPPVLELADVLDHAPSRPLGVNPIQQRERLLAGLITDRLATARNRVMCTLGAGHQQVEVRQRPIVPCVDVLDSRANVPDAGVVLLVTRDRSPPVVHGKHDIHAGGNRPGRRTTGTAEQVNRT